MKIKTLLPILALLLGFYGLSLLFVPESFLSMRGLSTNGAGLMACRGMGGFTFGFALLAWLSRNFQSTRALRAVAIALSSSSFITCWVLIMGKWQMSKMNDLAWVDMALSLVIALVFGNFARTRIKSE